MSQLIRLTKILREKRRRRVSVSFRGHNSTCFPMKSSVQRIWFEVIEPYYINYRELNIVKNKIDKIISKIKKRG